METSEHVMRSRVYFCNQAKSIVDIAGSRLVVEQLMSTVNPFLHRFLRLASWARTTSNMLPLLCFLTDSTSPSAESRNIRCN